MLRLTMSMFTILTCGAARLCAQKANEGRFTLYAKRVCAIRFEFITRKEAFSAGGTIECFLFRKIVACGLMPSWQMRRWPKDAPQRESTGKCAKEKNLQITRRFGQSLRIRKNQCRSHLLCGLRLRHQSQF